MKPSRFTSMTRAVRSWATTTTIRLPSGGAGDAERRGAFAFWRFLIEIENLERWVHGIVARTYKHRAVHELADNAAVPVINGLSDFVHPCQGLADFFTLTEKWGDVKGKTLCYIGDGNNTCHSLMHAAAILGAPPWLGATSRTSGEMTNRTAPTSTGPMRLGRTWRSRIHGVGTPSARAAVTNSA